MGSLRCGPKLCADHALQNRGHPQEGIRRMTPTLYFSPGACSLAPHIVLEEIGLPFALSLASTADGDTHTPEHLRLNPKGRVPVLVTGESVLTEAAAILLHLALCNPAAGLMPKNSEGLVRAVEWFNWLSGSVHAVAVRQVWRPESFTVDPSQHAGVVASGQENLLSAFAMIEVRLNAAGWAVGERYSVVDPYLLVFYRWGNRMAIDMRGRYSAWTKHTQQLLRRPAVCRAMASESISVWQ
jgi:glutathione S-transferase